MKKILIYLITLGLIAGLIFSVSACKKEDALTTARVGVSALETVYKDVVDPYVTAQCLNGPFEVGGKNICEEYETTGRDALYLMFDSTLPALFDLADAVLSDPDIDVNDISAKLAPDERRLVLKFLPAH